MISSDRENGSATSAIDLCLPASSANLGPGFDSAAIALDLYLRIRAKPAKVFSVKGYGRDATVCGRLRGNLVLETYRQVLAEAGRRCVPLSLQVHNEIPVGKGCGSSAAARLAGIALANHFGQIGWADERIVSQAIGLEGHADNVAACWFGGVVIVQCHGNAAAVKLTARGWPMLLVVSSDKLSTERSREVVPTRFDREAVVANLQSSMALVAAYAFHREDLLGAAQYDRLHQPYRSKLVPLLRSLQPLAGTAGIIAVTLSGAGSSVLLTLEDKAVRVHVRAAVQRQLKKAGLDAELLFTKIAVRGAQCSPTTPNERCHQEQG